MFWRKVRVEVGVKAREKKKRAVREKRGWGIPWPPNLPGELLLLFLFLLLLQIMASACPAKREKWEGSNSGRRVYFRPSEVRARLARVVIGT